MLQCRTRLHALVDAENLLDLRESYTGLRVVRSKSLMTPDGKTRDNYDATAQADSREATQ